MRLMSTPFDIAYVHKLISPIMLCGVTRCRPAAVRMMMGHALFLPLWLLAMQPGVPGIGSPTVTIPRIEATIQIDGAMDEPVWSEAARLTGFSQYQPVDGRPAEEQTDVLVWYSPDAIYFGIIAHDHDPASIRATVAQRDKLELDDTVTIYLDTFNDRRRAFFFEVNPLGVQQDGVQTEGQPTPGQMYGNSTDKNPDYRFESKGRITDEGYVVEIRIPFKSLRYPGDGPQRWGINIERKIQRTGYQDTWTDVRRGSASFLAQSGFIDGIHDLRRGAVTEIQPFTTVVINGRRDPDSSIFKRDSADVNPGVNIHFGLTNLSFDGTVKPDFSQVESDAGLVTINERFALFYPEKRPFFLEGIELFATPNDLVYTRQIVSPIAGAKLTGKIGRYGFGYLSARDDVEEGNAWFNVFRLRRDIGQDSLVGLTYTDRTGSGTFNRVLAGDMRIVFGKLYFVQGQIGNSWTHDDNPSQSSPIWETEFDRTGRAWGFNYKLGGIGESFEARSGYVPRNNIVEGQALNRLSWYGKRGAMVENVTGYLTFNRIWTYAGFGTDPAIEGFVDLRVITLLKGGWSITGDATNGFYHFDRQSFDGYEVVTSEGRIIPYAPPAGVNGAFNISAEIATPVYRLFNATLSVVSGEIPIFLEASEGKETAAELALGIRSGDFLRFDPSIIFSSIHRQRDSSEFARTVIPRLKIEYQPWRSLFFRVIGEYRSERQAALEDARNGRPLVVDGTTSQAQLDRSFRIDWLFSYQPTPGTSVFVGYGSTLEGDIYRTSLRRSSDGFFFKIAYIFRY